jgi:hypothetical protein
MSYLITFFQAWFVCSFMVGMCIILTLATFGRVQVAEDNLRLIMDVSIIIGAVLALFLAGRHNGPDFETLRGKGLGDP